jgi:RHS repeat-associated protein
MAAPHRRRAPRHQSREFRPFLEILEDRITPSLLGLAQQSARPDITSGVINALSYTQVGNNANPFHYDSIPLWITLPDGSVDSISDPAGGGSAKTNLDLRLSNDGYLTPGSGNALSVSGHVTLGSQTYDGTLLTAQPQAFGFGNSFSSAQGEFEVRLQITGGQLAGPSNAPPNPFRVGDQLGLLIHQPGLPITNFPQTFSFSTSQSGTFDGASDALNMPANPPATAQGTECGCGCGTPVGNNLTRKNINAGGNVQSNTSAASVNYFDEVAQVTATNTALSSGGFDPWGQIVNWSNGPGYAPNGVNGNGTVDTTLPYLLPVNGPNTIAEIANATTAEYFDLSGTTYQPRYFDQSTLVYNGSTHQYVLTDEMGDQLGFWSFDPGSVPLAEQGKFVSFTDPAGNTTTATYDSTTSQLTQVQRSATSGSDTVIETWVYRYITSGVNTGLLQNVTLERQTNGGPADIVRRAVYTYYDGTQPSGIPGDLMLAEVENAASQTIDTSYFRYYTEADAGTVGYIQGLKYYFSTASYARLVAAVGNPQTATDDQVAPYADNYFQYDSQHRVTEEVAQGAGCSSCSAGLGTFTYSYTLSNNPTGYNSWAVKTVETLPDGNENIVYSNYAGEQMLSVFVDTTTGQQWETFYQYDSQGRVTLMANPSAVTGYDDSHADLLNNQAGHYQYLRDDSGLITRYDYSSTTTATETTPGGVTGYQQDRKIQRGQLGTPILQESMQYFTHTANNITVHPTATDTVYRYDNGTGAETTSYSYTYYAGATQMESMTTTLPVISAMQNGPGVADQTVSVFDTYGRDIWDKDADGFLTYTAYDQGTGAVIKSIRDVNTANTSDFTDLPSGFSTPAGGGLHLITTYQVDNLGRTIKETSPNLNITYTVYDDPNHEVGTYRGWNAATGMPTGPTEVSRMDLPGSYTEMLTMSAAPHLTGGVPDGTEAISNVQTLARDYMNAAGQEVRMDRYFDLNGVAYSTALYIGTQNVNYYATQYSYDHRGRLDRTVSPTGTITKTDYDGLGRIIDIQVGTTDANLVMVSQNVYDQAMPGGPGGVGDSNLTQTTQFPGGGATPRVTQYFFDWRDRQVAQKDGVQAAEDNITHRPIFYTEYDNLNQAITREQYDGDGVGVTTTAGVPDKPAANRLRAGTAYDYDDQGRLFRTHTFSVDQTNGTVSANSLTSDTFYDHRGEVIETAAPGGLVTKTQYDGAGRATKTFTTDGLGDNGWADANSVANNNVLTQTETQYDANSNVILTIGKERFHDETATGELGDSATAPHARVSYLASYYDAADRLVASVNVGTNGGAAYTRPTTVPPRSDTTLITSYIYNDAGWVQDIIDPRGILTRTTYDNLQRTTKTIEGYKTGIPANDHDRTTEYTYDGSNHILTLTADLPGGAVQTTQYVYGVSPANGSAINSNDLLAATIYPDPTTGQPSTDNIQQVALTGSPTGGTFTLTFRGQTTAPLAYNADAPTVQSALQALSTIGAGNALVSGPAGGPWQVQFAGALAGTYVPPLTGDGAGLTGGTSPAVAVATQQETHTYNALGQLTSKTDRNGTIHTYSYDVLGRQTSDTVTTLGAGVDGSIRRIATAYDTAGRPFLYTSYDATSGVNVVNQTQQIYNGLGQLITEYQSHSGAVNTATTPSVQYAYSEMSDGANHSRLVSMTYPNGRVLNYNYDAGLDDRISRLSSESDSSGILEVYSYLGLSTVVQRAHPQAQVNLTYIQQPGDPNANTDAGDQYTGLDRFGRVIDQLWLSTSVGGGATDRFQYGYDRDSNVLFRDNLVNPAFGELYHTSGVNDVFDSQGILVMTSFIDYFNQLTDFSRGTLMTPSRDAILSSSHTQMWSLDGLGNWSAVTTDGVTQNRTHNQQNQITSISGATTPGYDNNGNTTRDETGKTFVYDAWNRLVQVKDPSNTLLVAYSYDALNRRVVENHEMPTDLYFSAAWQVLEERSGASVQAQYVWSPVYVDALVERDRGSERLYVQQDANWNVTALVDVSGNVAERYVYDPYGRFTDPSGQFTAVLAPDWSTRGASAFGWIYLHQGGRFDTSTGLYDFRNREYSPTLGRWLQQDPIGYLAGTLNLYQMEGNNPIDQIDPSGEQINLIFIRIPSLRDIIKAFNKLAQNALSPGLRQRQKELDKKLVSIDAIIRKLKNICPEDQLVPFAKSMLDNARKAKEAVDRELKVINDAVDALYPPAGRIADVNKALQEIEDLKSIQKETDAALKKYDDQRKAYDEELTKLEKRYRTIACLCKLEWVKKAFPGLEKPLPP